MTTKSRAVRIPLILGCAALIGGLAASSLAKDKSKAPKKKIVLKACQKKKPPVTFDHPAHVKVMEKSGQNCEVCHHLVDKKPAQKDNCSDCHSKPQGKLGTCSDKGKKNAFHVQCIGCHKKAKDSAKAKQATKCNGCHKK